MASLKSLFVSALKTSLFKEPNMSTFNFKIAEIKI